MLIWGGLTAATAQDSSRGILGLGNAVVTGFSGVLPPTTRPPGVDPTEKTFIDLDRPSARVIILDALLGPPQGQLVTVAKPFAVTAAQIGQVFAVALDDAMPPNIYLAASSAYGLPIVVPDRDGDVRPDRSRRGGANANFMPGLFGPITVNGGPGSIWKIDGRTGAVALFANVMLDRVANSGPALGGLAFDPATRQLFVADRDTGMIHRFGLDGADRGRFDHGVSGRRAAGLSVVAFDPRKRLNIGQPAFDSSNPRTWAYAPPERRIFGLAVREGRLFYAVAASLQIWSVAIARDGGFGSDPRLELNVPAGQSVAEISKIVFDGDGRMIVAERGAPTGAYDYKALAESGENRVLRFRLKRPGDPPGPGLWYPAPEEYAIGFRPEHRNSNGGIAIGYSVNLVGNLNRGSCSGMLWSTGDQLRNAGVPPLAQRLQPGGPLVVDGLQGQAIRLVRPQNEPPSASYYIDYDDRFEDVAARGHLGDVDIWRMCQAVAMACPPGTFNIGGACLLPLVCPPGTEFANGRCVYPGCPLSYVSIGGRCVPPPLNCKPNETYWGGACQPAKCGPGLVQLDEDGKVGTGTCLGGSFKEDGKICQPGGGPNFGGAYCACQGQFNEDGKKTSIMPGKDGICGPPTDCTGNNSGYWGTDPNCGTPPPTTIVVDCTGGKIFRDGACQCPDGTTENAQTGTCGLPTAGTCQFPDFLLPDNTCCTRDRRQAGICGPAGACTGGMVPVGGVCQCPPGTGKVQVANRCECPPFTNEDPQTGRCGAGVTDPNGWCQGLVPRCCLPGTPFCKAADGGCSGDYTRTCCTQESIENNTCKAPPPPRRESCPFTFTKGNSCCNQSNQAVTCYVAGRTQCLSSETYFEDSWSTVCCAMNTAGTCPRDLTVIPPNPPPPGCFDFFNYRICTGAIGCRWDSDCPPGAKCEKAVCIPQGVQQDIPPPGCLWGYRDTPTGRQCCTPSDTEVAGRCTREAGTNVTIVPPPVGCTPEAAAAGLCNLPTPPSTAGGCPADTIAMFGTCCTQQQINSESCGMKQPAKKTSTPKEAAPKRTPKPKPCPEGFHRESGNCVQDARAAPQSTPGFSIGIGIGGGFGGGGRGGGRHPGGGGGSKPPPKFN